MRLTELSMTAEIVHVVDVVGVVLVKTVLGQFRQCDGLKDEDWCVVDNKDGVHVQNGLNAMLVVIVLLLFRQVWNFGLEMNCDETQKLCFNYWNNNYLVPLRISMRNKLKKKGEEWVGECINVGVEGVEVANHTEIVISPWTNGCVRNP